MYGIRSLKVSFAVLFVFMFCFGTSVQAASTEVTSDLLGPESDLFQCDGDNVGRATIAKKELNLAERIVGGVLRKDKSSDRLTVTLRFRNGPDGATFNVFWIEPDAPGDCYAGGNARKLLGQITTDSRGRGKARFTETEGNPFPNPAPGGGVVLFLCLPDAATGLTCESPVTDFDRYTATFPGFRPPPAP